MQECCNFICQWENEPGGVPIRIKHLFLARFLHNLAHILQEMMQDFARDAATCKFAHFCNNWCKIVQESCKKKDISRARAKQVLHARFLHNLA